MAVERKTTRRLGVRRVIWAVRVYPQVFDKADEVLGLPETVETDRSQLLRRYIREGLNRDLKING